MRKVAEGIQEEGDRLLRSSEFVAAIQRYRNGLDMLPDDTPEGMELKASLYGRLGLAFFLKSDVASARVEFSKSLRIHRQLGKDEPGKILGEICHELLKDPKQYWALVDQWNAVASVAREDEELKSDLAAARKSLARLVVDWLERPLDPTPTRLSVVTPIVMEIGAGLIPADTSDNWSLFKTYIPEMRARFESQLGVRVPGVQYAATTRCPPTAMLCCWTSTG